MSDERSQQDDPQPMPTKSPFPELWPMLIARMQERHEFGVRRYKVALQPFNGRDALKDLVDEALDGLVYQAQWFYENRPVRDQVREFRQAVGHPLPVTPIVPDKQRMLFALSLFIEEAFEVVEACYPHDYPEHKTNTTILLLKRALLELVRAHDAEPDMELLVDALGDTDYVTEGFRLELGVDGRPVAALIHAANMQKLTGPVDPVTQKKLKPPGWVAPDILGELRRQGWSGT